MPKLNDSWIASTEFTYTMVPPGSEAQQLATCIGRFMRGTPARVIVEESPCGFTRSKRC